MTSSLDLKRFGPFADLLEEEVELLEDLLEPLRFDAGVQLFRHGQESDGLWLILEGSVRLEDARGDYVGSLGGGEVLGSLSLMVVGPRACTARAEEDVEALRLSRTAFHRLTEDAPRAGVRILAWLVRELAAPLRAGLDQLVER